MTIVQYKTVLNILDKKYPFFAITKGLTKLPYSYKSKWNVSLFLV